MREDLNFKGNDLNYVTATFWASYCTFMIPACYFMTHYPANYVLPGLEVGWGICTFGLAWSQNLHNVYAMRFFTGIFECCSFTGTIYVIGSWYKPGEIGRRVSLFFIASPLGTMFAGYLQAAAYTNLHGVHGIAGWRLVSEYRHGAARFHFDVKLTYSLDGCLSLMQSSRSQSQPCKFKLVAEGVSYLTNFQRILRIPRCPIPKEAKVSHNRKPRFG